MAYYPVFLDISGRRVVVIGGGAVAERKVEGLLVAGAQVTVVSPVLSQGLDRLRQAGAIEHRQRAYRAGDLCGFELAFSATDDGEANSAVSREGRERGIWVNSADDPEHCDFILPSVLRRGELVVAVSSGGASPALARAVREELEGYFTADYAALASLVGDVRRELRSRHPRPGAERWSDALSGEVRWLVAAGQLDEARRRLLAGLGVE
jgi:precorrin-2 dehydrogenase / sirohydrochlorin ferrochelatase